MRYEKAWIIIALPCLLLQGGCAETTFQDMLGIGKSAPDETKVRTVQPLSVPPDLDLRPPLPGNAKHAGNGEAGAGSSALSAPPAVDAPVNGPRGDAGTGNSGQTQHGTASAATAGTEGNFYDIYRKHGISIYGPDGKRKKISQLNRELAEQLKEERRRKNPRSGTIFNIDSLWK